MRFENRLLDEIRARLTLSDLVGRRVNWDRRKTQPGKGDYWACCPFHQEKSPSFHVDDRRNRYKCFGCGASGDHFTFVCETEGLSFPEAVERLAEQAGVALPAPDPQAARREKKRAGLADICEMAALFFQNEFAGPRGEAARAYCAKRDLLPETLREFRFGFAPDSRDALKSYLAARDIPEEAMVEAGLVIRPDDGRPGYDRFRGRLMIPIQDDRGRVVAFGGRTLLPDGQPKYLNSPETPLFHKGVMLFNAHRAREPAFKANQAVVVEGYLDAIALWQAGIRHVVATLGTAFTETQISSLWRLAPEPIVCFDGDTAGLAAANRSIDRMLPELKSGYSFHFVFLPNGSDPDDIVRGEGRDGFIRLLEQSNPLSEVLWSRETESQAIDTPERKAALEKRINSLVSQIKDERVQLRYRHLYRVRLAQLFWQSDKVQTKRTVHLNRYEGAPGEELSGLEKVILGLCVEYPDIFENNSEPIMLTDFSEDMEIFKEELHRILVVLENQSPLEFYRHVRKEFYETLDDVHGKPTANDNGADGVRYGYNLRLRFPILNYNPDDGFVERCVLHFLRRLGIRMMENDIESMTHTSDEKVNASFEQEFLSTIRAHAREQPKNAFSD
jgi:DNA primase